METAFWGWLLRGLGGLANLIARAAKDGPRIGEQQLAEARDVIKRLEEAVNQAAGRHQGSGAPAASEVSADATTEAPETDAPAATGQLS